MEGRRATTHGNDLEGTAGDHPNNERMTLQNQGKMKNFEDGAVQRCNTMQEKMANEYFSDISQKYSLGGDGIAGRDCPQF